MIVGPVAAGVAPPLDIAALLAVVAVAWGAGRVAGRFGMPAVLGELLAGIVLGPALLGWLMPAAGLDVLAELGILLMMLVIGTEIDLEDLRRASGGGLLAAIGGFVVPAGLGIAVVLAVGGGWMAAVFVGMAIGVTSLATKSRILADLDLLQTRIAHVLMAGALLSDTAVLVGFAVLVGIAEAGTLDAGATTLVAVEITAFLLVAALAGRHLFPRVGAWLRDRRADVSTRLVVATALGLAFAALAEVAGLHGLLGTFVAGVLLRRDVLPPSGTSETRRVLHGMSFGLLAPVFFVTAGFQISFDGLDLGLVAAIVTVACLGKILGTALFYLPTGRGWAEGLTIGAGMNGRGAVEIVVAGVGLELGIIDQSLFTALVVTAVVTTATVPVLLPIGVRWLRRRGELDHGSDLRRGFLIVGAGPVARTLAGAIAPVRPVVLVDRNERHVAAADSLGLTAVHGDALDAGVQELAQAPGAAALLGMTGNAEANVLAARVGHERHGIPESHVALGDAAQPLRILAADVHAGPLLDVPVDLEGWDHLLASGRARCRWLTVGGRVAEHHAVLRVGGLGLPLVVQRDDDVLPFAMIGDLEPDDRVLVLESIPDAPPPSGDAAVTRRATPGDRQEERAAVPSG